MRFFLHQGRRLQVVNRACILRKNERLNYHAIAWRIGTVANPTDAFFGGDDDDAGGYDPAEDSDDYSEDSNP